MIEIWERPRCLICGAIYKPGSPSEDMCATCRRRMHLENYRDPEQSTLRVWARHMQAQLRDKLLDIPRRPRSEIRA